MRIIGYFLLIKPPLDPVHTNRSPYSASILIIVEVINQIFFFSLAYVWANHFAHFIIFFRMVKMVWKIVYKMVRKMSRIV